MAGLQSDSVQKIQVPLSVGAWVQLYEEVDLDDQRSSKANVLFEDEVAQYVPQTALLRFKNSEIGRAEFIKLLEKADGFKIINNYK